MTVVLSTRGLRKTYGSVVALHGLDLDVYKGEVFGFLGPNGAGKTTFTKCVTGFVRPDAGEVRIAGLDARQDQVRAAFHVGLVPDQYDFYSNLTGRQHLDFYGRLLGMGNDARADRIAKVLATVRMEERADAKVKGYSHGMKQRICIAQAILHQPDLIFFDEPTNGLDPQGAFELREMIKGLAHDGTTVFLNSHQLNEVEQTCQRVAIVDRGQLKTVATVKELQARAGAGGGTVSIQVLNPSPKLQEALAKAVGPQASLQGDTFSFAGTPEATATAVTALARAGGQVVGVRQSTATLESAFLDVLRGGSPGGSVPPQAPTGADPATWVPVQPVPPLAPPRPPAAPPAPPAPPAPRSPPPPPPSSPSAPASKPSKAPPKKAPRQGGKA